MWLIFSLALLFILGTVKVSSVEESKIGDKVLDDVTPNISTSTSDSEMTIKEFLLSTIQKPSVYGENLTLNEKEIMANQTLMFAKLEIINKGSGDESEFWPSKNFLNVRQKIEQSKLFKLIRMMPKGGVLHTHGGSTVSLNFLYEILTHLTNLYVCSVNETLQFRYFDTPNKDCEWKLLEKLRKEDPETVSKLRDYFTAPLKETTSEYNVDMARKDLARKFSLVEGLITYRPAFEIYVQRTLQEIWNDNILYMEFRAPIYRLYELDGTIHEPIEAIKIFKNLSDTFVTHHPGFIGAKYIHTFDKLYDHEEFKKDFKIYKNFKRAFPGFVVGFDILTVEDVNPPTHYDNSSEHHDYPSEKIHIHTGATTWVGDVICEESIEPVLRNTIRIDQATTLLKYPELMDIVKEKNISIELNPISNQVLGYVDDFRKHPAAPYFEKNLPVIVSNDSPSFWGASGLSYDFYETFLGIMPCNADLRSLKQLAMNSIEYSAMTKQEKQSAFQIWNNAWIKFVQKLVNDYRFTITHEEQQQKKRESWERQLSKNETSKKETSKKATVKYVS